VALKIVKPAAKPARVSPNARMRKDLLLRLSLVLAAISSHAAL
jgi:hypothetical protein